MKYFNLLFISLLLLISVTLGSCFSGPKASTRTTSSVDPDFTGKKFKKICVKVDVEDLETRQKLEKLVVEKFLSVGVKSGTSFMMLYPTKNWSDEEINKLLSKDLFDGLLVISITSKELEKAYIPKSSTTTRTRKYKDDKGETVVKTNTTTSNSTDVRRSYSSNFTSELFEVKTYKKAWIATSKSFAGHYGSFNLIFKSFANDLVQKLADDGLVDIVIAEKKES